MIWNTRKKQPPPRAISYKSSSLPTFCLISLLCITDIIWKIQIYKLLGAEEGPVLSSSTMMGVLPLLLLIPNNSNHLVAVKTLLHFILENIHQSSIVHFSDQRITATRNFCNMFNKSKEQLELIKDGQQERNLTGNTATRKLEQWKSLSGKKHTHPESNLYPEPHMFYEGQDTVDK